MHRRLSFPAGFAVALLAMPFLLEADTSRVMVGEDILIAEDEIVEEVVCIGCSVRVEGEVRGDALVIAGGLEIPGEVDGDAVVIAGGMDISGRVKGDAAVIAGGAGVSGEVGGDMAVIAGGIGLAPSAVIRGDAAAVAGEIGREEGSTIEGEVTVSGDEWALPGLLLFVVFCLLVGLIIQPVLTLAAFLICGEQRIRVLAETTRQRAGVSFLLGLGVWFSWMVACAIMSLVSPIGAAPVNVALFVLLVVGYCGISYWVGRGLLPRSGGLAAAVLGAVLITFLQVIPLIGQLIFAVFATMAVGSAVLSGLGSSTEWLLRRTPPDTMAARPRGVAPTPPPPPPAG